MVSISASKVVMLQGLLARRIDLLTAFPALRSVPIQLTLLSTP
jgi:hypothetical protein